MHDVDTSNMPRTVSQSFSVNMFYLKVTFTNSMACIKYILDVLFFSLTYLPVQSNICCKLPSYQYSTL